MHVHGEIEAQPPRRSIARLILLAGALGFVAMLAARLAAQAPVVKPGDPMTGLTPVEFTEFRLGLDDFTEVETAEEGLGPAFNGASCAVCHNVPAIGGGGLVLEVRAGYRDASGAFSGLNPAGDTLMHLFSIPSHGCQPQMPYEVNVIARRAPIPLFGAGLVEAIADDTLLALEDPLDRNGDGVSGRAARVVDPASGERRVGRFGWKAQHATLLTFGADAYRNEMGITNDVFRDEVSFGVEDAAMRRCDPIPDPEDAIDPVTRRRGIDNFASFMRLLAPTARRSGGEEARDGERLFAAIGCPTCHVPTLTTAQHANPLFDRRPVELFSDLLLHDVGTGDGIAQGAAEPHEIRTPALWGLGLRKPFLHDGRASTIEEAIEHHAGEAALARQGYLRLDAADRARLLAFLRAL
jgi:CxxC motif-containing protein (DUF1111 family)